MSYYNIFPCSDNLFILWWLLLFLYIMNYLENINVFSWNYHKICKLKKTYQCTCAATILISTSERIFPYTKTGQHYINPEIATRLYLGCQSQQTSFPLMLSPKCSTLNCPPVNTSHNTTLPFSDGDNKYLLSGDIEQLAISLSKIPPE